MKFILSLLILLGAYSASAKNVCFWKQAVFGFSASDNQHLTVRAGGSQFLLDLGYCNQLSFATSIAFDSFTDSVCRGDSVLILDNFSNRINERCPIVSITKL